MSNILAEICDYKRTHVAAQKSKTPLDTLHERIKIAPTPRGFLNALKQAPFPAIIAEVKKASPSKGIIREDFNPAEIATTYEQNGAACLSVLTDEPYFQGSDAIFKTVRDTVTLPLLRKDFMVDSYQIYESRAMGADCVLLIMAALSDDEAATMHALAVDLGMDVLVETHDLKEIERALKLSPHMVGINNRNLKTMDVSIQTSIDLAPNIPPAIHTIAESGLSDHATLKTLRTHGFTSFLIGESLMRQPNIGKALRKIRG